MNAYDLAAILGCLVAAGLAVDLALFLGRLR